MRTTNEQLSDLAIQHALNLLRWANGEEREVLATLEQTHTDLVKKLAGRLALIDERGHDLGRGTTKRLEQMLAEVKDLIDNVYSRTYDELADRLGDFAETEGDFQHGAISKSLTVDLPVALPAPEKLRAIAVSRPFEGFLLKDHFAGMAKGAYDRYRAAVTTGITEGESIDRIVARVRGTKAAGYRDGAIETSRASARRVVRTAANHVANQAAQATWEANKRLLKGWQFLATLDSRTTLTCASLDGQVFDLGLGPVPPRHLNCRSISVAVVKSYSELGIARAEYTPSQRASMDGQVAGSTTFADWIAKQSPERQDKVFGKTRADLYRAGKLDLKDFVRDTGEVIPLDELKKMNANLVGTPAAKVAPKPAPAPKVALPNTKHFMTERDEVERDYVLEHGRKTGNEHLVAYDQRGKTIQRNEGQQASVGFTPELQRAATDPKNALVLHHNHPRSSSLSYPDMDIVSSLKGVKAIWAHAHNGSAFYAEKGARSLKRSTVNAVAGNIQSAIQKFVSLGTIPVEDAQLLHNHLTWVAVDRIGEIKYHADLVGESAAAYERNKAIYELILESLK